MENILEIKGLTKKYKHQLALDNVSLTIKEGDIYGLIGRNGAGKTTLLKAILQLITQNAGTIQLFGGPLDRKHVGQLSRAGSIIETPTAYEGLTAKQNLTFYCKLEGIVDEHAVEDALAFVGLEETGKKKFKDFSLGMKQKLGLAIALLKKPDFLILDEPVNGLDPVAIVEFRELLLKLNQEGSTTILISSHILDELYHIATRFGFINKGKLVKEITKEEFVAQSSEFIKVITPAPAKLANVLKQGGIEDFKVIDETRVHIYDTTISVSKLNRILNENDIEVEAIQKEGKNLEEFFRDLVAEA